MIHSRLPVPTVNDKTDLNIILPRKSFRPCHWTSLKLRVRVSVSLPLQCQSPPPTGTPACGGPSPTTPAPTTPSRPLPPRPLLPRPPLPDHCSADPRSHSPGYVCIPGERNVRLAARNPQPELCRRRVRVGLLLWLGEFPRAPKIADLETGSPGRGIGMLDTRAV
jgi:hypothetical protein